MLFFRSEERIRRWCSARNLPGSPLVTLDQLWLLAVTWYGTRLTVQSRRPAPDEMVTILAQAGLEGDSWDPRSDRFA